MLHLHESNKVEKTTEEVERRTRPLFLAGWEGAAAVWGQHPANSTKTFLHRNNWTKGPGSLCQDGKKSFLISSSLYLLVSKTLANQFTLIVPQSSVRLISGSKCHVSLYSKDSDRCLEKCLLCKPSEQSVSFYYKQVTGRNNQMNFLTQNLQSKEKRTCNCPRQFIEKNPCLFCMDLSGSLNKIFTQFKKSQLDLLSSGNQISPLVWECFYFQTKPGSESLGMSDTTFFRQIPVWVLTSTKYQYHCYFWYM